MSSISIERKAQQLNNRREIRDLQNNHQHETKRIKLSNDIDKSKIRTAHSSDIANIRDNHSRKLIETNMRNEKVLDNLKKSIDTVKETTNREMHILKNNHAKAKTDQQIRFEHDYSAQNDKSSMMLQDLNDEANIEIQKLNRQIEAKKHALKDLSQVDLDNDKQISQRELEIQKKKFEDKKFFAQDKFSRSLMGQKREHDKILATQDTKQRAQIEANKKIHVDNALKVEEMGQKRVNTRQKHFEKDFKQIYQKQEKILQELIGKKESLIQNLREQLKEEFTLELEKDKDPFYNFTKLDVNVTTLSNDQGYEIKIPVEEHEASKVSLTAYDREIKVEMERSYKFQKSSDQGSKNTVNKVESYLSKIPVEDIVDSKSITKTYNDGVLTFNVKLA